MSGLVLKMSPKERLLLNGAVIENGTRRARISILSPNAKVLRLKDAIHPEDANTPVKRACCFAQYLISGDVDPAVAEAQLVNQLHALSLAFGDLSGGDLIIVASRYLDEGNAYGCLKTLRQLLPLERRLLSQ